MSPDPLINLSETIKLLVALADAFDTPHQRSKQREPILFIHHMGGGHLQHHAFDTEAWTHVDEEMVQELAGNGLVRLEYQEHSEQIYVTAEGMRAAGDAKRLLEGDPKEDVDPIELDWDGVARPVLEATYAAWTAAGAPTKGVLTTDVAKRAKMEDRAVVVLRALDLLADGGYVAGHGVITSEHGPPAVSVTARGLQAVGGWPATSAEAAVESLLASLDRAIEETDEPERRTKLEKLRQATIDVGSGVLTNVLSRVVLGD